MVWLCEHLMTCNASTTFFIVQSKSLKPPNCSFFSIMQENGYAVMDVVKKIFFPIFQLTSNSKIAKAKGFRSDHIFEIPEKLGGRFSIWSAMGLSLALMTGKENFDSFRLGAKNMDKHFYEATFLENLPMIWL